MKAIHAEEQLILVSICHYNHAKEMTKAHIYIRHTDLLHKIINFDNDDDK
jgi:hypothetical protein